jgi:hypothetical protein
MALADCAESSQNSRLTSAATLVRKKKFLVWACLKSINMSAACVFVSSEILRQLSVGIGLLSWQITLYTRDPPVILLSFCRIV